MGRYYSGDIEGKFWFGVQSSTAADRFGVEHSEPSYVEYYYTEENLERVKREIRKIKSNLGDKLKILEDFFNQNNGYQDKQLHELGITGNDLSEYADLLLGIKIKDCLVDNGECTFQAEL